MADRASLAGIAFAAAYHQGRDVFPHNPAGKVRFFPGDQVFFRPDAAAFGSNPLQPGSGNLAEGIDVLADLCVAARQRSIQVHAWVVFLHNFTLGSANPGCVSRNAFGDPYLTDLCPANPFVRAYVRSLAAEIGRYRVSTVIAESLHFHPLEHGFHHERYLIDLAPASRFLLGLCFCEHCLAAAATRGVDSQAVRSTVRSALESAFTGDAKESLGPVSRELIASMADGEMAGYLATREETISSLVEETAAELRNLGVDLAFMDASGAIKGYADGRPKGEPTAFMAWELGIDLRRLSACCAAIEVLGYAARPDRLRVDMESYRQLLGDEASLCLALRPTYPDVETVLNLAEKIRVARSLEVSRIDFYHYGLMRLRDLDRIREALGTSLPQHSVRGD